MAEEEAVVVGASSSEAFRRLTVAEIATGEHRLLQRRRSVSSSLLKHEGS